MHPLFLSPSLLLSHYFLLFICLPRGKDMARGIPTVIRPGPLLNRIKNSRFLIVKIGLGLYIMPEDRRGKKTKGECP